MTPHLQSSIYSTVSFLHMLKLRLLNALNISMIIDLLYDLCIYRCIINTCSKQDLRICLTKNLDIRLGFRTIWLINLNQDTIVRVFFDNLKLLRILRLSNPEGLRGPFCSIRATIVIVYFKLASAYILPQVSNHRMDTIMSFLLPGTLKCYVYQRTKRSKR